MARVLIVDDSHLIRERVKDMLSELSGVEAIHAAEDYGEALLAMKRLDPDVVILDVRLPGRGGIELLSDIKERKPDAVVIMFTDYPYPEYRRKSMEAGADYFFLKSSEFEKVIETVERLTGDPMRAPPGAGKGGDPGCAKKASQSFGPTHRAKLSKRRR